MLIDGCHSVSAGAGAGPGVPMDLDFRALDLKDESGGAVADPRGSRIPHPFATRFATGFATLNLDFSAGLALFGQIPTAFPARSIQGSTIPEHNRSNVVNRATSFTRSAP